MANTYGRISANKEQLMYDMLEHENDKNNLIKRPYTFYNIYKLFMYKCHYKTEIDVTKEDYVSHLIPFFEKLGNPIPESKLIGIGEGIQNCMKYGNKNFSLPVIMRLYNSNINLDSRRSTWEVFISNFYQQGPSGNNLKEINEQRKERVSQLKNIKKLSKERIFELLVEPVLKKREKFTPEDLEYNGCQCGDYITTHFNRMPEQLSGGTVYLGNLHDA